MKVAESEEKMMEKIEEIHGILTPGKIQEIYDPLLIQSLDGRFNIRIEKHLNKDTRTFHFSLPIFTEGSSIYGLDFPRVEKECRDELKKFIETVYATNKFVSGFLKPFSLSFTKSGATSWDQINPEVIEIIFNFLSVKYPTPVVTPEAESVSEENQPENIEDTVLSSNQEIIEK